MLNSLTYSLPEHLESAVRARFEEWRQENKIARLWQKDSQIWTNTDEANWLGWLGVVDRELNDLPKYHEFAEDAKNFKDIVLLGMGGSSLGPEVFSITFDVRNFHVLDSTVPAQVKTLENRLDLSGTLFIVASKSGSTLEPNCFKQYFYERVAETVGAENAGRHFIAITDPNSKMQTVAKRDGFRKIFFGEPEIGGRFSVLSVFGMVAASAMQIDTEDFLKRASEMVENCRIENPSENAGAILGTILGVSHASGRDKLTIFTSPEIYDTGAWLEQLIAESTGKEGVSIIPVDREPLLPAEDYSTDRIFVYLKLAASNSHSLDEKFDVLSLKGHPTVKIELIDKMNLGQEFFRWEFATAVAGALMKINPFDQPDVESAKIEARKLTDEYEQRGELPVETPIFEDDGIKLFTSQDYAKSLEKLVGTEKSLKKYLESHIRHLQENDYFALLAYLEMNAENAELLQNLREKVLLKELTATCLGFGPRFLHSTGQGYKGGANNGVFLQITSDDAEDFGVPGQKYTFGVVKTAQARGDFQVLLDRGRRALRIHIPKDAKSGLAHILDLLD